MNSIDDTIFSPILLHEVDLSHPVGEMTWGLSEGGRAYSRARLLVRIHTTPIGFVELEGLGERLNPDSLASLIWEGLQAEINEYLKENNQAEVDCLGPSGLSDLDILGTLPAHDKIVQDAPFVSVIVTTHDRPDSLEETLRSIAAVEFPRYEIIVVDNAPSDDAAAVLVERLSAELPDLRYIRENRIGLCWARNCGLDAAQGDIIVFTDDDVLVDREWLNALVEGFAADEQIACVNGLILPRELETPAQIWCEEHGGFGKGLAARIYDLGDNRPDDPLFPYRLSMFGSGANMSFRTDILRQVGGCDPALGAGTPTRSAAEFPAFYYIISAGYQIAYRPDAIVYHSHHRRYEQFRKQFFGYGVGYAAFLTKIVLEDPRIILDLLGRVWAGLSFLFNKKSPRHAQKKADYPRLLNLLELLGLLYGPLAYILSRYQMRKNKQFTR